MYDPAMEEDSASGWLALDFLNTIRAGRAGLSDIIGTPEALVAWMLRVGLVDPAEATGRLSAPSTRRTLLTEARRLRSHVRDVVVPFSRRSTPPAHALYGLNRVLGASRRSFRLSARDEGLALVEEEHASGPLAHLARIARNAAGLVTQVDPSRVRQCASPSCVTWFVDTSKGGRRKWCSMARCGNRAKAAQHRRRLSSRV